MPAVSIVNKFGAGPAFGRVVAGLGVPCLLDIVMLIDSRTTVRILCPCGPIVSWTRVVTGGCSAGLGPFGSLVFIASASP